MGCSPKAKRRPGSPVPGPDSPGGPASIRLKAEIGKGAFVALTSSWDRLRYCFSEVDYVEDDSMRQMCGGEFMVLCQAPPSLGVPMIVLSNPAGDRSYFPTTAVVSVIRGAPMPPYGHQPTSGYWIDTASDYIEGAVQHTLNDTTAG